MDLAPQFAVHRLNERGIARASAIGTSFTTLLAQLESLCQKDDGSPNTGRELAVCKTKLEEACFFAKKAMATQPGNQTTPEERAKWDVQERGPELK